MYYQDASSYTTSSKKQEKKDAAYDLLVRIFNNDVDYY